jgi:F-type H+-transporting ATPase subunit b
MKRLSLLLALIASPAWRRRVRSSRCQNTDFVVLLGFIAFVSLLVYLKVPAS